MNVLFVDDNKELTDAMEILLDGDYTLHTAYNGDDAWNVMNSHSIDLVLTDIEMPGMDGFELMHKIKENYPDTYVVAISGHDLKRGENDSDWFDRVVVKPYLSCETLVEECLQVLK